MLSDPDKPQTARASERKRWDRTAALGGSTLRRESYISQQELADRIGWTRDAVANAENGRRALRISDLIIIARALRMEPEALTRKIVRWNT